jgi:hypothetical protein
VCGGGAPALAGFGTRLAPFPDARTADPTAAEVSVNNVSNDILALVVEYMEHHKVTSARGLRRFGGGPWP